MFDLRVILLGEFRCLSLTGRKWLGIKDGGGRKLKGCMEERATWFSKQHLLLQSDLIHNWVNTWQSPKSVSLYLYLSLSNKRACCFKGLDAEGQSLLRKAFKCFFLKCKRWNQNINFQINEIWTRWNQRTENQIQPKEGNNPHRDAPIEFWETHQCASDCWVPHTLKVR